VIALGHALEENVSSTAEGQLLARSRAPKARKLAAAMPRRTLAPRSIHAGVLALAACLACKGPSADPVDAAPSPQAKAEPAPLAVPPSPTATTGAAAAGADGSVAPEPLRPDRALATDVPRDPTKETTGKDPNRELSGYVLQAIVRTGEGPGAPRAAEVNGAAEELARRKTESKVTITVASGRARFVVSGGFVLPQGAELRSRWDAYGHLLLLPGEDTYRVVPPGALRALLGERRLDVAPVSPASMGAVSDGPRRSGLPTRRLDVATRAAKTTLEIATVRDAGEGGALVCRWLLDLTSAPPSTSACASDDVPMHAELRWTTRGSLVFDVLSITRRADLSPQDLAAPPASASFTTAPLPAVLSDVLLPKSELASLRTAPSDAPASANGASRPQAPDVGLLLVNSSDELRLAWIDGFAAAWVAPGGRALLSSLARGRYVVEWRTFLGDSWEPAETLLTPATSDAAGARPTAP
jgi:hypothetical protein